MDDLDDIMSRLNPESNKFIVVDGIFSMEGDVQTFQKWQKLQKNMMLT